MQYNLILITVDFTLLMESIEEGCWRLIVVFTLSFSLVSHQISYCQIPQVLHDQAMICIEGALLSFLPLHHPIAHIPLCFIIYNYLNIPNPDLPFD